MKTQDNILSEPWPSLTPCFSDPISQLVIVKDSDSIGISERETLQFSSDKDGINCMMSKIVANGAIYFPFHCSEGALISW